MLLLLPGWWRVGGVDMVYVLAAAMACLVDHLTGRTLLDPHLLHVLTVAISGDCREKNHGCILFSLLQSLETKVWLCKVATAIPGE